MSIGAKFLGLGLRMSGMKKKYALPEDRFLEEVRKMNRSRGFYMPRDHKAVYKEHTVLGRQCLIVQKAEAKAKRAIMKANNPKDMMVDYAFMERVERYEKQGRDDVPEFMIHISKGDLSGVDHIHFVYSMDEVLYGAKQNFIDACEKYGVKYTVRERPGMIHCYAMLPYFKEAKEDFEEIARILAG